MAVFVISGLYKDKATKDARRDLRKLTRDVSVFGNAAKKYYTIAATAATYYAQKTLRASIRAAIDDEQAQKQLALTLGTVAGATEAATIAAEANIKSLSQLFGIADDDLRPAMARLARVTGSTAQASSDLDLALTLATATGYSLEQATLAISRAYTGNYKALKGLGLSLDDNLVKNKDTAKILKQLKQQYTDLARNQLETTAVKFNRIKVAAGEATEAIGVELITAIERLIGKKNGIDGVGTSIQDTADYVADLIGSVSILASQTSSSSFVGFLKNVSRYTNLGAQLGDRRTGLQDIKKALDALRQVNRAETARLSLIKSQTTQKRSLRYEEELAKKKAKEGIDSTIEGSKKTVDQLIAEEYARKAGFKITEDIDSIQTVAAAKRLAEAREYKMSILDAAKAQYDAIASNYTQLDSVWQAQMTAFKVMKALMESGISLPIAMQISGFTGTGVIEPVATQAAAAVPIPTPASPITNQVSGLSNPLVAGSYGITNVTVNAGAVGSEQYLADLITRSITQANRSGVSTIPAGYLGIGS